MNFILLKTFGNYIEANIALSMLEEAGINCHIEDENTLTLINMSSGIRLMVHQSHAERAVEVLKEAEIEYLKNLECPQCHHKGFEIKMITESHESGLRNLPFGQVMIFLSKLLSKEGASMQVKHYQCANCRKEFENPPA